MFCVKNYMNRQVTAMRMKNVMLFLPVLLLLLSGCGRNAPTAGPPPFVRQEIAADAFDSAGQCQYCHLDVYRQWQGSAHANAASNPLYLAELARLRRDTDGESDDFCSRCHIPVGWLAGESSSADGAQLSAVSRQGVSCDFCHTVSEVEGVGNGKFRVAPGTVKRGPFDDPLHTPIHESAYDKLYTQAEYCGVCHEISHPQNGLRLSSTYSEWKESGYGSRRVTCQDCHMTPGPGVTKPNPGVAATGAPKRRDHISTHYMTGNSVFSLRRAGFEEHAALAEESLKSVAFLHLGLPERLSPYQPARINVRIRNDGAGHYLPTGLSMYKDMWLEVVVTDGQGKTVFSSGVTDSRGYLPAGSVTFATVYADATGKETANPWEAVSILDDNRIPPQKYVDEFVEIPGLPLPGVLQVEVRLLYRNLSPGRVDVPGLNILDVPVVEMARATGQITVR
jgi:hypothetical protein